MKVIKMEDVETRIVPIRGENVLLDSEVASIYGVATKAINQAAANNPNKFPEDYIIELTHDEKRRWSKILTASKN